MAPVLTPGLDAVMKRAVLPWHVGFREVARAGVSVTAELLPLVTSHGEGAAVSATQRQALRYQYNSLENLLVSGSMNGLRYYQQNLL